MFLRTPEVPQKIERLPPSQFSRILGVCITPGGSSTEHTKQLRSITTAWSDRVRPVHIRKSDDCYYSQMTIKKFLEYPLVGTKISQTQCHLVEYPDLCSALHASGLSIILHIEFSRIYPYSYWIEQWKKLCNTRENTYIRYDGPWLQQQYNRISYKIPHRGAQA